MTTFYKDDKYEVRVLDKLNIVVEEKGVVQKGKTAGQETRTVLGYYSTLGPALKKLMDVKLHTGEVLGTEVGLYDAYQDVTSKLKGLNGGR